MSPTPINRFATAISTWLLVEGIWGMCSRTVLGVLTTNRWHAAIHLGLGLAGLWTAFNRGAAAFLWALGVILLAVGIAYLLPGGQRFTDLLAVNAPVAWTNLGLGGAALCCAVFGSRR